MLRFFLLFLLIQGVLFTAEMTHQVQAAVVLPFTGAIADLSAWLIRSFDTSVIAYANIIQDLDNGFAVSIEAGCNGVEAAIVLFAAMLAFPSPWRYRLLGMGIGFLTVQTLNIGRIITLFYLGQWSQTLFEWAHLYIWQALIMLDVLLVFLVWLRVMPRRTDPGTPHAADA